MASRKQEHKERTEPDQVPGSAENGEKKKKLIFTRRLSRDSTAIRGFTITSSFQHHWRGRPSLVTFSEIIQEPRRGVTGNNQLN